MGPCNRTREELDGRLREAGYGKDADMFACFFRRSTAEEAAAEASKSAGCGAILCLSCGHSIGDHGGGTVVGTALGGATAGTAATDERPVAAAAVNAGGDDDRAALLGGGESKDAAAEEGADDECTPPLMAPGMTSKHAFDELFIDESGLSWKVMLVLAVAGGFFAYHLMRGFYADRSTGIAGYLFGLLLGCVCLSVVVFMVIPPLPIASMYYVRVAHLEEHAPSTAGAFGSRALWLETLQQRLCCGNPDFTKHFKARDVQSVQLDYNAVSPGSAARVWLNMKPSPGAPATQGGGVGVAVTTTTTTPGRGPSLLVFRGKCADPRGLAEAWREYLKPNAPQSLAHVDGLAVSP